MPQPRGQGWVDDGCNYHFNRPVILHGKIPNKLFNQLVEMWGE